MAAVERSFLDPHVALLTMNRPERLNAMNADLVQDLHDHLDAIAVDPTIRVVVLTGAGRGFCAGVDISGYGTAPHTDTLGRVQTGLAVQKHIATLIPRLRSLPQPVIAATNGPAHGGGLALVLGSDIRIAGRSANFSAAFLRIGLSACDIGTSWLLPRIVGVARAQELMVTARTFDADEAYRIGLVVDVHDDDALLDAARAKAQLVLGNAPFGVAMTKDVMWTALEIPGLQAAIDIENRQQIMLTATADHREAMIAFLEKRPPEFTNT